ncbi:MAG: amino acid ABC transporter permease [Ruminococcaceae bacterium]|nr:amino acid ABC transporter permease [Oscillospiraceae bacterium]
MAETWEYFLKILPALHDGLKVSLKVFFLTIIFAIPLGLPLALGSISKIPPIRWICKTYILIFRGTPLMLQLFFFYFFLPRIFRDTLNQLSPEMKEFVFKYILDALPTAIITFVLNYAAYFAEIYRGGIESIDKGQHEAAQSLGISKIRTMFGIIIPQTVKRVLPSVANETITLVKDTSLVYVIGVGELMKAAKGAVNRDQKLLAYAVAAGIYLLLTFLLTLLFKHLEKRFSKSEEQGGRKRG